MPEEGCAMSGKIYMIVKLITTYGLRDCLVWLGHYFGRDPIRDPLLGGVCDWHNLFVPVFRIYGYQDGVCQEFRLEGQS